MNLNELITNDLKNVIYNTDEVAVLAQYKGLDISVIYDSTYEVQSIREKVLRVQSSDVVGISNSDTITIGNDVYRVISFIPSHDELEMIIGVEI